MNQINNIQVGNQTYQIGGTGSGSTTGGGASGGLTMGNQTSLVTIDDDTIPFVFARTNTFSAVDCSHASADTFGVIAGLPQDFMGESGELWSMAAQVPIVVSHNSIDIEGHPHKACMSMLQIKDAFDENSSLSHQISSLLSQFNSVNPIIKLHSTSKFLELTESDSVFIEYCLGAGTSIQTEQLPAESVSQMAALIQQCYTAGHLITGSKLMTAFTEGAVVNIALDITGDETSGYTAQLAGKALSINSLEPGSIIFVEGQPAGFLIDIRDNQVEAAEVPNYVFGVYNPSDEMLVTNIPIWWNNDTPPTFADQDTLVQISVLAGVGNYITIHIPIDEILENLQ